MQDFNNGIIIRYLTEKKYRVLRHSVFIVGLLFLFSNSNMKTELTNPYKTYLQLSIWVVFVCMFYINMYVLIPHFFFKGRYEIYILLLILLVTASLLIVMQVSNYMHFITKTNLQEDAQQHMNFFNGILVSIPIILTTTTLKLFNRWIIDNKRISELKNLALTTELMSLKSQIQPHFLFNMLNNVKALIRKDPAMATEVIIKLSDFLRYQLYENDNDKTFLLAEINFITNFLKLEEIRRDRLITTIQCEPELVKKNIILPPHIFTAFIENAIKYSLSANEGTSFISISFIASDGQLHFECRNSKDPYLTLNPNKKYSGLGLTNTKRRLELLYQDNFHLDITAEETEYIVKLTIPV